jgi:ubiquinone/menaquinone biosynthesis C-methylase UbiE
MLEYNAFNSDVFLKVPHTAMSILDVGCGTGAMAKALKKQYPNRKVSGLTYSLKESKLAALNMDKVWVADINIALPAFNELFDCIIFSHILEHIYNPKTLLKNSLKYLKKDGIVIIALPNILQYKQRIKFFKGEFKYSEHGGLMDVTHFRFFDWASAQELITGAGCTIISKQAYGNFPFAGLRNILPALGQHLDRYALKKWPGLFGFQFIFVANFFPNK